MAKKSVNTVLDSIYSLPMGEQEMLVDIIKKRIIDQKRDEIEKKIGGSKKSV